VDGITATLISVSPTQINFLMPQQLGFGPHKVIVKRLDWNRESAPLTVTLVANSPTLATITEASGIVRLLAQINGTIRLASPTNIPQPGDILVMYALGVAPGSQVQALADGQDAPVLYAGPAGFPGLTQINLQMPDLGLPNLFLKIGNVVLYFPNLSVQQ
jgi:uncharacterized protein (TIGR03437 family)